MEGWNCSLSSENISVANSCGNGDLILAFDGMESVSELDITFFFLTLLKYS